MGTSCYLPQNRITTTTSVVIRIWTVVLVSIVMQLSHAQMVKMGHNKNINEVKSTTKIANERVLSLEKEVVERLIKEWAPIVWLAPEEKFMPLGVEEFLRNVHAVDKGNSESNVKGMPLGDNSKKAYLVTNSEIEELLENDSSFLYGKDPNEHNVPIYAVVRLCSSLTESKTQTEKSPLPPPILSPQPHRPVPYIPVSMNGSGEASNTIRRSSRLFPLFSRTRRNSPVYYETKTSQQENININTPLPSSQDHTTDLKQQISTEKEVSEFIANLSDNVKFTGDSGMNNNINDESIQPQKEDQNIPSFHVTYWMFYPYSQGKTMCTVSLGPLGNIPFPAVYGYCLGNRKDIGSHVGDWEHMSLYFDGTSTHPNSMYVSAHDAGAYYSYNHLTGSFEFKKQETRKGILQRPNFPKTVTTFTNHPVLFAAKGSHGLWTAPGKHRFVKVARLYDVNGFGTPWHTWKAVDISYENLRTGRSFVPTWLHFKGKWGNPKSKCHPLRRIGLNFCEYTDGPTGIPLKEPHFQCDASHVLS